jgi:hypothetical protein
MTKQIDSTSRDFLQGYGITFCLDDAAEAMQLLVVSAPPTHKLILQQPAKLPIIHTLRP